MNRSNNSFAYISDLWLENNKVFWKESTYAKYTQISVNLKKAISGNYSIGNINSRMIQKKVNSAIAEKTMSVATIKSYISVINSILSFASANNFACVESVKISYPKPVKSNIKILTEKEQKTLTKYLLSTITPDKLGILLALYTGIRCGELCALKWQDIDLPSGIVTINKTMQRIQCGSGGSKTKIVVTSPKTANSNRIIPLPLFLIRILKKAESKDKNVFLLTGKSTKGIEPRQAQNVLNKCLQDCMIGKINFHALRHTFASRCIELGVDYKTLSEILGHANVTTTMNLYVHSSTDLKRREMNKLNFLAKDSQN